MKQWILMSLMALVMATTVSAKTSDEEKKIRKVIAAFAKAGDQQDADALASYLDDNYRVVMNRLFGSKTVNVLTKEAYLQKIRQKEFGGDARQVKIEHILLNGTTATAKVVLKGNKLTFVSILNLAQNADGEWKLISDLPMIQK